MHFFEILGPSRAVLEPLALSAARDPPKWGPPNMLGTLRENKNSWAISAIVGLIVLAFIVWGPGTRTSKKGTIVARVNGVPISKIRFGREVRNEMEQWRRMYQQEVGIEQEMLIRQRVLDRMIQRRLLLQEAERLGIIISDQELREHILSLPYLKDENGKFDVRRWKRILRQYPGFEQEQREDMQVARLIQFVQGAVEVSEADVRDLYVEQNTKVNLEFVKLSYSRFERDVEVTPEDREAYFKEHEAEVRQRYEDDFDRLYNIPKKVKASHILLKYGDDDDEALRAELMERMKKIREEALTGDFADLARRYSEDPGTATRGGSLGYFEKDRMDPAFAEAAFSTPVGEISDIVESRFGLHIIKVEDVKEAEVKTFDEVKDQIVEKMIRKERAPALCRQAAERLRAVWVKGGPELDALLKEYGLSIQETGLTPKRGDMLPRIGSSPELVETAFSLRPGDPPPDTVFDVGQAQVLIRLKARQEADMSKFEEEKESLRARALRKKQNDFLSAWIDTLKAEADIEVNPHVLS